MSIYIFIHQFLFICNKGSVYTLPIQKNVLKDDFEISQSSPKGVISEIGDAIWRQGYAYILSMGRGCVRVENTHSFFTTPTPHRCTAISVGAFRDHPAIDPLSYAIAPRTT
jgi:hypothetical protein